MKKRGGAYRGTLKARINKLYGGDVTCSKVKNLKGRRNKNKRDVQLANWFINMHNCKSWHKKVEVLKKFVYQLKKLLA